MEEKEKNVPERKKSAWVLCLVFLLVFLLLFAAIQRLVVPKYADNREGNLTGEYYAEAGGHDLLIVGDCEVYEGIIPAVLYEKTGITSYVRGSSQQLVWQSYYLLEEMLSYETPKAVVFNVLSLKYGEPQNEAYNRMTLDGMKWSAAKRAAVNASMTEEESLIEYYLPLLRYHDRITDLKKEDFTYFFRDVPPVTDSGYLMQTGILPRTDFDTGKLLEDYEISENAWTYLDKMRTLCEERGIALILIKAPTDFWRYYWYDEWEEQVVAYAKEYSLDYYNFIPLCDEMGIDWSHDTYDGGAHLNVYGAEKFTEYLGTLISGKYGLTDRRGDPDTEEKWSVLVDTYRARKEKQEKENS